MRARISKQRLRIGVDLLKQNPLFVGRIAARVANRLCHRRGHRNFNRRGIGVFEQDWDNLVLLDACRYEMLQEHPFDGEYATVTSRGSDTYEFLQANCPNADLSDTVYVSASPVLGWHTDKINQNFHDVIFVWRKRGWDRINRTVMPDDVRDVALRAVEEYPNKRLFVHFLQPHYPFIESGTTWDKHQLHETDNSRPSFWREIEIGNLNVSPQRLWELYENNLDAVLPYAEEIVDEVPGKTVVTSDHGNMFGERSTPLPIEEWGHPLGTYTEELVTVPWIECAFDRRREIVGETDTSDKVLRTQEEEAEFREKMSDLGYIT